MSTYGLPASLLSDTWTSRMNQTMNPIAATAPPPTRITQNAVQVAHQLYRSVRTQPDLGASDGSLALVMSCTIWNGYQNCTSGQNQSPTTHPLARRWAPPAGSAGKA